ncbi:hypothetical protein VOLCADRAFT_107667 [Volvox carteri f. nagariensis]|uniref:ABC transporter n=1 Tax=Volvox carteri f. nagariensis TaxID=3068 RepID=D8UFJ1_VOLCA|nr:uncharacterized protein VOLCADRAFT_107667 [Volvox carteri f. nagariensis]EFJ41513.1 hypothetical protein VOLCADRAFT_107667 [Volvox carteri f. nagariensis]|eukprot:XP_002957458.1 hypothetical protein VOLCADRAFT_107667 [Volvox carteri f. nagariensis]
MNAGSCSIAKMRAQAHRSVVAGTVCPSIFRRWTVSCAQRPCTRAAAAFDSRRVENDSLLEIQNPSTSDPLVKDLADVLHLTRKRAPFDNEYLLGLVWRERRHLALALFTLLLCTASNLAAPVLSGMLLEMLVSGQSMTKYAEVFAILATGYVLEPLLTKARGGVVYMYNVLSAGEKVLATLRLELFRTLLMQRLSFFDRHTTAELTALISVELDAVRSFIFNNVSRDRGLRAFLEAAGSVVVLFALSWRLAPVCSVVVVVAGLAAAVYRRHTRDIERRQGAALSRMVAVAQQALDNMRIVRSFAGEALERERFQARGGKGKGVGAHVGSSYRAGLSFAAAKAWFESANRGAIHASLLALYAWGGWLVSNGLMPVRVLVSGIGFTFSLMYAVQGSVNTLSELRRASGAFQRVRDLIQNSDPDPSMYGALPPGAWWEVANGELPAVQPYGPAAGDRAIEAARRGRGLELRDVYFAYPARPESGVLQGLQLTIPHGRTTALVGLSGAGKSTVAALLSRFYEPQEGVILLDGQPIDSFTRGEWARAVSLVSQDPVLFSGTIADNIAYGKFGMATLEEIQSAAKAANAHDFITKLPDGYRTVVGERGVLLSGGQRQRIALARAIIKDSPIIILDEATSALDVVSERLVQQAINRLVAGRTVLVIAHRLATVQAADQIVVMRNGRVVEAGTHDQLIAKPNSHYSELMSVQNLSMAST